METLMGPVDAENCHFFGWVERWKADISANILTPSWVCNVVWVKHQQQRRYRLHHLQPT